VASKTSKEHSTQKETVFPSGDSEKSNVKVSALLIKSSSKHEKPESTLNAIKRKIEIRNTKSPLIREKKGGLRFQL